MFWTYVPHEPSLLDQWKAPSYEQAILLCDCLRNHRPISSFTEAERGYWEQIDGKYAHGNEVGEVIPDVLVFSLEQWRTLNDRIQAQPAYTFLLHIFKDLHDKIAEIFRRYNHKKVISQGPSICVFQKDNPQEVIASWLFVKYLTTTVEFQAEFAIASGYVPVLKSVSQNPIYAAELESADGFNHTTALSAKVCLEQADYYYTSPAFVGSSVARTQVGNLIANCLTMTGSDVDAQIAKAFQDAVDECEYQAG
jgi:hypothetical protein